MLSMSAVNKNILQKYSIVKHKGLLHKALCFLIIYNTHSVVINGTLNRDIFEMLVQY